MRHKLRALFSLFFLVTLMPAAIGSDPPITAKAEVDQALITIGDRVHFRVTVAHDPKVKILNIDADQALRDFEVKDVTDFSYREGKQVHDGKTYVITNYELGEYVIRPVTISWQTADGRGREFQTNSLYVTVESIDQDTNPKSDIRGVKGVYPLEGRFWPWLVVLGIAVGTASLTAWYLVRKRAIMAPRDQAAILSPHEEAYQALYRLKHSDYLHRNQYKLYFLELSELLRRYFQRRYQISALESTTTELMSDLKDKLPLEQRTLIQDVVQFCDAVKFAKHTPSVQEVVKQNKQAFLIIDQTKETGSETSEPIVSPSPLEASKAEVEGSR